MEPMDSRGDTYTLFLFILLFSTPFFRSSLVFQVFGRQNECHVRNSAYYTGKIIFIYSQFFRFDIHCPLSDAAFVPLSFTRPNMGLNDDEDDAENQIKFFLRCLVSSRVTFEMCWGCNQEVMMVVKRNENNHTENTFQFFLSISFEIYLSQDYFIFCSIETSF